MLFNTQISSSLKIFFKQMDLTESVKFSAQAQQEETQTNDDDFYENIEAPKFVDFAAPDTFKHGDDKYWFCSRVGCTENHEAEMDSEAIYQNFVLRVMAARSPIDNRFRKALYGKKSCGSEIKCPRTVPAKPSRSRVSKLALISSISKKIGDPKVKGKPVSKQGAISDAKAKQASAAAKSKNRMAKADAFQSAKNPKVVSSAAAKNIEVVKALVFNSPKKPVSKQKATSDAKANQAAVIAKGKNRMLKADPSQSVKKSVKGLSADMKRLEITGAKNQVLGCNKSLKSDSLRKPMRSREVKSRVFDGILTNNYKMKDGKSWNFLKKTKKEKSLQQNHGPKAQEKSMNDIAAECNVAEGSLAVVNNPPLDEISASLDANHDPKAQEKAMYDVAAIKTEEKGTEGAQEVCSSSECNAAEGHLATEEVSNTALVEIPTSLDADSDNDSKTQEKATNDVAVITKDSQEVSSKYECVVAEEPLATVEASNPELNEVPASLDATESELSPEKRSAGNKINDEVLKSEEAPEETIKRGNRNDMPVSENDDKENASAIDENRRKSNLNSRTVEHKIPVKHKPPKANQKITSNAKTMQAKENSTTAACHKKLKPTNPKPFRLRTDERGILKEANLEKKIIPEPLGEITAAVRKPAGHLQKRPQHAIIQREENRNELNKNQNAGNGNSKKIHFKNTATSMKMLKPQRHTISSQLKLVDPHKECNNSEAARKGQNQHQRDN